MTAQKTGFTLSLGSLLIFLMNAAGAVEVVAAWARPTAPGAKVGGAFMTIIGGQSADRVVSASSPAAAALELHTHVMNDGVAQMRAVSGIDVPAKGKVELKPGGLHIMLINLQAPLKAGDKIPLTLRFEKAGERTIKVPIMAQAPDGKTADAMGHDQHGPHQPP